MARKRRRRAWLTAIPIGVVVGVLALIVFRNSGSSPGLGPIDISCGLAIAAGSALATLLDALFANAPVGLGLWDRELRYQRLNAALAEMNGLPIEAHLGRTVAEALPELDASVGATARRVLETGVPSIDVEVHGQTAAAP